MEMQGLTGSRIILVRHARPVMNPDAAPETWALDPASAGDIALVAKNLRTIGAHGVVTSPEPKARETGKVIAAALAVSCAIDPDLAEQGGGQVPWISSFGAFEAAVAAHFSRPSDVILGMESSAKAVDRFERAVRRARLAHHCPVIVTHGRIMCGYMARVLGIEPMSVWPTLRMPDALVLDLDDGRWHRAGKEEW